MTFQQKYTNLRDFYLVKKGPKNLGIGNPPLPPFRAMPESKQLFSADVFPKLCHIQISVLLFSFYTRILDIPA